MLPSYQNYQNYQPVDDEKRIYSKMAIGSPTDDDRKAISTVKNFYRGLIGGVAAFTIMGIAFLSIRSYYRHVHNAHSKSHLSISDTETSSSKPNLIFIYLDDMGFGSIGYDQYDLEGISPFITSLMKDGVLLTNYYGQEECTPSRTSLMTGRYPITTGNQFHLVLPQIPWGLNLTEVLFPEILKSHGNYATAAVGKWHLGHHDTAYLPTNRGFDQFSGYLLGQIYPWSKTSAADSSYYDSIYADTDCYAVYNLSDTTEFTTFLYTKQAVRIIEKHDFDSQPLYLYLSLQAVHEPFSDLTMFQDGIPASYIGQATYDELQARFPGKTRFEYALSLLLADRAIETVYNSVVAQGVLDNTYFVIASDNGGCQLGGGRNGDLRGAKGTLYEGGLKVDALIHSPLLPSSTRGSNYSNLFHVSDWFPTLTSFLGIDYTPTPDHAFDGVDHSSMILNWGSDDTSLTASPRTSLIYNIYYNIYDTTFDDDQYPYAVRDEQYKLLRTYTNNTLSDYYDFSSVYDNDDDLTRCQCNQDQAVLGDSEHYLYDLINDPNETNNLYYSTDPTYVAVKQKLEAMITERLSSIAYDTYGSVVADDDAYTVWENHDDYIIPWSYSGNVKYCTPKTDFI